MLFGHSLRSWHRELKSISSGCLFVCLFSLGTPVYKTLQLDTSRSEVSFCLTKPVYIHFEATAPEGMLPHSTAGSVIALAEAGQVSPRGAGGSRLFRILSPLLHSCDTVTLLSTSSKLFLVIKCSRSTCDMMAFKGWSSLLKGSWVFLAIPSMCMHTHTQTANHTQELTHTRIVSYRYHTYTNSTNINTNTNGQILFLSFKASLKMSHPSANTCKQVSLLPSPN